MTAVMLECTAAFIKNCNYSANYFHFKTLYVYFFYFPAMLAENHLDVVSLYCYWWQLLAEVLHTIGIVNYSSNQDLVYSCVVQCSWSAK